MFVLRLTDSWRYSATLTSQLCCNLLVYTDADRHCMDPGLASDALHLSETQCSNSLLFNTLWIFCISCMLKIHCVHCALISRAVSSVAPSALCTSPSGFISDEQLKLMDSCLTWESREKPLSCWTSEEVGLWLRHNGNMTPPDGWIKGNCWFTSQWNKIISPCISV